MSAANPLTIPVVSAGERIDGRSIRAKYTKYSAEVVRLYRDERIGAKLIAKRLSIPSHAVIRILAKAGVYRSITIPHRGSARSPAVSQRKILAQTWTNEWQGVVEDYWPIYESYARNLERSKRTSKSRYQARTIEQRKVHNKACLDRRARTPEQDRARCHKWRT